MRPKKERGNCSQQNVSGKESIIKTAYDENETLMYDEKRFSNPKGRLFNKLEMKQLERVLRIISQPAKVLEVGCGTGRFILRVLKTGHEVHGLDPSSAMLQQSEQKTAGFKNVYYHLGEGANLPFGNETFDFVYSIRVLDHVSSKAYALNTIHEMIRVCKNDRFILVEFVNKKGLTRDTGRSIQLSIEDIQTVINDYRSVKITNVSGILIFSQTLMNLCPTILLGLFDKADRFFSNLLPTRSTRCYVTLHKTPDKSVVKINKPKETGGVR